MTRADYKVQVITLQRQATRLLNEGKFEDAQKASRLASKVKHSQRPIMGKLIRDIIGT